MHWIYLDPGAGYRGDEVEVSVRCDSDHADLESEALKDITLHRDGRRLTGITRVERDAQFGLGKVRVRCRGGDNYEYRMLFRVLPERDHEEYLEITPAYGHRGDEIDIHVGCDRRIGRLRSDVLEEIELERDGRPWRFAGTTHVLRDAEPGEHEVSIRCGDRELTEYFFVEDDSDDSDHSSDDPEDSSENGSENDAEDSSPGGGDQVRVFPKGAPETGGGPVDDARLTTLVLGQPSEGQLHGTMAEPVVSWLLLGSSPG